MMEIQIALMAVVQVVQSNLVGNVIALHYQVIEQLIVEMEYLLVRMSNVMMVMEIIQMDVM